jgi:hypothetical protein
MMRMDLNNIEHGTNTEIEHTRIHMLYVIIWVLIWSVVTVHPELVMYSFVKEYRYASVTRCNK